MPEPGDTFLIRGSEPPPSPQKKYEEPQIFDKPAIKEHQEKIAEKPQKKDLPQEIKKTEQAYQEEKKTGWQKLRERVGVIKKDIRQRLKPKSAYSPAEWKQKDIEAKRKQEERQRKIEAAKVIAKEKAAKIKERVKIVQERARETGVKAGEAVKGSRFYAGLKVGIQETKAKEQELLYRAGKEVGRLPVTAGKKGVSVVKGRYEAMRESIRMQPGRGAWHGGLLWEPGAGMQRRDRGRGGIVSRIRSGGGYYPRGVARGRMPRSSIPRGLIKPYWSKKLKKMARTNIRRFGEEEGMARTRQVASMLGWKMQ